MAEFTTVAKASEVDTGEVEAFDVGGRKIAVANVNGTFHAFDDTCTHAQCSLADGDLDGTTVECPCHGSAFDVTTGEVINGPATDPVDSFPARVEGEDLQVEM